MARARNIKPSFFTNDMLGELDPLTRLLFAGLWCLADRDGRLEDRPKKIKAELLPYDNCDCDVLLETLEKSGFIARYVVNGAPYIQVVNFSKHQRPHNKEAESAIPAPPSANQGCVEHLPRLVPALEEHLPGQVPARPDTLNLIPDTGSLIPDSPIPHPDTSNLKPDSGTDVPCREAPTTDAVHEVVAFLNLAVGANFRPSNKKTREHVRARLREGYSVEDFKTVVWKKHAEWGNDPDMAKYLRPETLFGTKFEGYLNQPDRAPPQSVHGVLAELYHEAREGEMHDP